MKNSTKYPDQVLSYPSAEYDAVSIQSNIELPSKLESEVIQIDTHSRSPKQKDESCMPPIIFQLLINIHTHVFFNV